MTSSPAHDLTRQLLLGAETPTADAVLHLREVRDARTFGSRRGRRGRAGVELPGEDLPPPSLEVNAGHLRAEPFAGGVDTGRHRLAREGRPAPVRGPGRVVAYREDALWEDVGSPEALVRASRALVLRSGRDAHIARHRPRGPRSPRLGRFRGGSPSRRRGRCTRGGLGGHDSGRRRGRGPGRGQRCGTRTERQARRGAPRRRPASRMPTQPEAGRGRRPAAPGRHPGRHHAMTRRRPARGTARPAPTARDSRAPAAG